MRHTSRQFVLCALLLLLLPIWSIGNTAHAGFINVTAREGTGATELAEKARLSGQGFSFNLNQLLNVNCVQPPQSDRAKEKTPPSTHQGDNQDWLAFLKKNGFHRQQPTNAPSENFRYDTGNPPAPNDQTPSPRVKYPPSAPYAGQNMGGTASGLGAGSSTNPAGLPSIPALIGPELAMRLFAQESLLQVQELAWRFFRPPRIELV